MPSRTVWSDVYHHPQDHAKWAAFREHYGPRVYTWAFKLLARDRSAAECVTVDVFRRLYETVRGRDTPVTPHADTCAGYVFATVRRVCADLRREEGRRARLTEQMLARLESDDSRRYLERLIDEAERGEAIGGRAARMGVEANTPLADAVRNEERATAVERLAELDAQFRDAVRSYRQVQAGHKERSRSWDMFWAAYSVDATDGLGPVLDARFGFTADGQRNSALKYANRVADRLCELMGLCPAGEPVPLARRRQLRDLIRTLVHRHAEHPSG